MSCAHGFDEVCWECFDGMVAKVNGCRAEVERLTRERDEARDHAHKLANRKAHALDQLERWRNWAQFVYRNGGPVPPDISDEQLRDSVCQAHDADTEPLKARCLRLEAALKEIAEMMVCGNEHDSRHLDEAIELADAAIASPADPQETKV